MNADQFDLISKLAGSRSRRRDLLRAGLGMMVATQFGRGGGMVLAADTCTTDEGSDSSRPASTRFPNRPSLRYQQGLAHLLLRLQSA